MEWFERWFQEEYDKIYVNRNDQQAIDQVGALLNVVDIPGHAHILDIGCGKGRHLKELQSHKYAAVGIDLSFYLLKQAQIGAHSLARSDMRFLPFKKEAFDMVCSFFTSFGYFETREENIALIDQFSSLVKPGGYLFLDLMNKESVLKTLPKKDTIDVDGRQVTQDRYFKNNCVCKDITIVDSEDRVEHFNERVMVFDRDELYALFKNYNLSVKALFGDERGNEFTQDSPRMSFILQKGD